MSDRRDHVKTLVELAHDTGEADALWYHAIGDRMSADAQTRFIRAQGHGGFVSALATRATVENLPEATDATAVTHMGRRVFSATGDLALAWQQGFESTLAWLDGRGADA